MQQDDNFRDYVALADQGRNGLGTIILGAFVALVGWLAGTATILFGSMYGLSLVDPALDFPQLLDRAMSGRLGAIVVLTTVASFWPAVWLALRLVHRRAFVSVLGSTLRIDQSDMWRGFAASIIVTLLTIVAFIAFDGPPDYSKVNFWNWLVWLLPMALLILLQTSAEELFFRGYLMQALAHRFRSPIIWAGLPLLLFTMAHWYDDANASMNAAAMVAIGAFAASTSLLVYLTGNLGAGIGVHWGNNIVAFLVMTEEGKISSIALSTTQAIADPAWTDAQAFQAAVVGIFSALATIWLLIHPRSPLRLDTFRQHQASD